MLARLCWEAWREAPPEKGVATGASGEPLPLALPPSALRGVQTSSEGGEPTCAAHTCMHLPDQAPPHKRGAPVPLGGALQALLASRAPKSCFHSH